MNKRIMLLCLVFTLLFSFNIYAEPTQTENVGLENEGTAEVVPPSAEEIERQKAASDLQVFFDIMNNKGKVPAEQKYITVIKGPKEVQVLTVPEEDTISDGVEGLDNAGSTNDSSDVVVEEPKVVEETFFFGLSDSEVYFSVEDLEYELWMEEIKADIVKDAKNGLNVLSDVSVTLDHIQLKNWGEFFNKYYGKTNTNFPLGDVVLTYGDKSFTFINSKDCKEFILTCFIEPLVEVIEEEAKAYPVKRYALDIKSGSLLKDYVCDLNSVREIETVYPFDDVETHIFYNTGDYFALTLGKNYVDILRGYVEDGENSFNRRVEGEVPGCVNVLSYITLLRNVSGGTINDKVLSDFTIYNDLAIRLDTKELIDTTDMTTTNKVVSFSDFKLNADNLVLAPIQNDVVIIQPLYLECFQYDAYNRNFGRVIDVTSFLANGGTEFDMQTETGMIKVPISHYCDSEGLMDIRLGNYPFLMYFSNSYVPYDLIINWAYNQSEGYITSDSQRDALIGRIKSEMAEQGRQEEYDAYIKAAGQMTDTTKLIIKIVIAVVVLIAVLVVVIIVRKKLKAMDDPLSNPRNSGALFMDEDEMDYDDDDDDVGFELK